MIKQNYSNHKNIQLRIKKKFSYVHDFNMSQTVTNIIAIS